MLRKLGNISWASSRAQCKLDQFGHATKMAAEDRAAAACIVIALLMEEDNERRTRGPDRDWIKRRREKGAFQNVVKELAAEDLHRQTLSSYRPIKVSISASFQDLSCLTLLETFWTSCKGCVDKSGAVFSPISPDQQGILRMLEVVKPRKHWNLGNIVSMLRKLGNICCRHKMFLTKIRNIFCVPGTKFVSATNVVRTGKRGNICVGNNVSATMCPRLPVPLVWTENILKTKQYENNDITIIM